ncbi:MAG: histidine phosphatase family protein [Salaquimonas sp.]|jgi:probable phosphoglycerate mutase|nr:histidine phosphatase family protein [Salaquimonas sp.]
MAGITLYYVRHGQTDWNAELRFQGRQDIPLNQLGRAQAHDNGRRLAKLLGKAEGIPFVTSPLGRACETMEIIRAEMGLDPEDYRIDDRLIEASYGTFEGLTLPQMKEQFPDIHRQRKQARWAFQPPKGESHAMVLERILVWLDTLETDTLVCGHGVVGRVLRQHFLDIDPDEAAAYPFPQDKVFIWQPGREEQV